MKLNSRAKLWFVSLFTFANFIIYADTWTDPDSGYTWTYSINGDTAAIYGDMSGSAYISPKPTGVVLIPSKIGGKILTRIGNSAFYGCSSLTSVTIPDSVTSIGESAFDGTPFYNNQPDGLVVFNSVAYRMKGICPASVTIPKGVTSIGPYAFSGCSGLTSVTIPDSVTNIGLWAFYGCSGLTSVHISDLAAWCGILFDALYYLPSGDSGGTNPLTYAHNLYLNGTLVTNLTIPDGVTRIGNEAFVGCSGLTSVTIPDSVTNIGYCAFSGCSGLTSVTIPDSVTNIMSLAFEGCSGLTSATLPPRWALSSIFPSYSSITNVTIPSGSTGIVNQAFKGCTALTSISIPDSVTSIGDEAFYNCTFLEHLAMPEGVTSYGVNCFEGCPAYTLNLYRAVFGGGVGSGSASVVTTIVQNVEAPYALTNAVADHAIASVTVDGDCAIDSFVLRDGKVYDSVLYISNTADRTVTLTLPSGYVYKAIKGARPLEIPAKSQSILSITRVANNVFLVSREDLETIQ